MGKGWFRLWVAAERSSETWVGVIGEGGGAEGERVVVVVVGGDSRLEIRRRKNGVSCAVD